MSKNKKKIDTAIQEKILLQTYRASIKKEGPGQTRTIIQNIKNNAKNYQLLDNAKKAVEGQQSQTKNQEDLIKAIDDEMRDLESELLQFTEPRPITLTPSQQYKALLDLEEDILDSSWDAANHWARHRSTYSFDEEYCKTAYELRRAQTHAIRIPGDVVRLSLILAVATMAIITGITGGTAPAVLIISGAIFGVGCIISAKLNKILQNRLAEKKQELSNIEEKIDNELIKRIDIDHEPIKQTKLNRKKLESPKQVSKTAGLLNTQKDHTKKVSKILDRLGLGSANRAQIKSSPQVKSNPRTHR